jgi:hypothetical protein
MQYDYSKLRERIRDVFHTQSRFADAIGMGRVSLNLSLNNKRPFNQHEIQKAYTELGFELAEVPAYFFTEKVQKQEQK